MDTMEKKGNAYYIKKGMGQLVLVFLAGFLIGRVRVAGGRRMAVWNGGLEQLLSASADREPYMALAGVLTAPSPICRT